MNLRLVCPLALLAVCLGCGGGGGGRTSAPTVLQAPTITEWTTTPMGVTWQQISSNQGVMLTWQLGGGTPTTSMLLTTLQDGNSISILVEPATATSYVVEPFNGQSFVLVVGNSAGSTPENRMGWHFNFFPSATSLASSMNPSLSGAGVTLTASVTQSITGAGAPLDGDHPGSIVSYVEGVTFMDGNVPLGTGVVNGAGVATLSTSSLAPGSHAITALYSGDLAFMASTSQAMMQVVTP